MIKRFLLQLLLFSGFLHSTAQIYQTRKVILIGHKDAGLQYVENWLETLENTSVTTIDFGQPATIRKLLKEADLIWIHRPDTTELNSQETTRKFLSIIKNYLNSGGSLFLTRDAMRYLPLLGLEKKMPEVQYAESVDRGYGRKLGLHSFRSHAVFHGMNGGAYIWNPTTDERVRMLGYFGNNVPDGRVVAVNWAYIRLHEDMKIMLEHNAGKGKVLSVGAYVSLDPDNRNLDYMKKFLENCLEYLTGSQMPQKNFYWEYDPVSVTARNFPPLSIDCANPVVWDKTNPVLSMGSEVASQNFWDIAGERILVMGFEQGGIDEIWVHPFMAFRDYELGIRFDYRDTIYWFNDQQPAIEVRPEGFIRTYQFPRAYVTEILAVSPTEPTGVFHYEYRGVYAAELIVKLKSNLRFMWPYSEHVFRELNYWWEPDANSLIVAERSGDHIALFGSSKAPVEALVGRYDGFLQKSGRFAGFETDKLQVSALLRFRLGMNENLDLIVAGSNEGFNTTTEYYRKAATNPEAVFKAAQEHYSGLLNNKLILTTPDAVFNEGYRWALAATDRFFVRTPGVGSSLVAGYSTTRTGWGGGHAINGRPGYGWYFGRDAQWSGLAVNGYGDHQKVREVLETFQRYQDLTGKIYHEMSTSGVIHYDASDATPLYIVLAAHYLRHSGDTAFIRKSWNHIKKAVDFCFSTDTDGDRLIESTGVGHGWVEGGSLYTAHTEVYLAACWARALEDAAFMAEVIGYAQLAKSYREEAGVVKAIINRDFWDDEGKFLSFSKLRDGSFNNEKTVLPAVALYWNLVETEKGRRVVDVLAGNAFSSDWGVRILSELSPLFNPRGYHYGSVWPLFTGWASLAGYKYGNALQGYAHIMNNLQVYQNWALGFVEEVLHGSEYKPGGVCPHQCWSQTMVLLPVIEGMLGFEPNAPANNLTLAPVLPFHWDTIRIQNLRSGENNFEVSLSKDPKKAMWTFRNPTSTSPVLHFRPAFAPGTTIREVLHNGSPIAFQTSRHRQYIQVLLSFVTGAEDVIEIMMEEGMGVLPVVPRPVINETSAGLRILGAEMVEGVYSIRLEGRPKHKYSFALYAPGRKIRAEGAQVNHLKDDIFELEVVFDDSAAPYLEKVITVHSN